MKPQTIKLLNLSKEYEALKKKVFENTDFFAFDEPKTPDEQRYNQLFQFFHPSMRTKEFINPLN